MVRLQVRRAQCGPIGQAWNARVDDWIDDGSRIVRLSSEYRKHYRETICAKCSPEEQARRGCAALTEGCSTLSCSHMNRAFYSKYRKIIRAHLASHPLMERIRLNARLDEARGSRGQAGLPGGRTVGAEVSGRDAGRSPAIGLKESGAAARA